MPYAPDFREMMRLAAVLGALLLLGSTEASAFPILIRAGSRIALTMERVETRMVIRGHLREDDGSPIPDAWVQLVVHGQQAVRLLSAADGSFVWQAEVPLGRYSVGASFSGSADVEGTLERRTFELGKTDVDLDIPLPARIDRGRDAQELEVRARSSIGGAGLQVELYTSDGRQLARGITSSTGVARFVVPPRMLGKAGGVELEARSSADALRGPGRCRASTMLVARSRLQVEPPRTSVTADGDLLVRGRLHDEQGPIARGAIELQLQMAAHIGAPARAATDAAGRFVATVSFEGLPHGQAGVTVAFIPEAAWRAPASAGPFLVEHRPPSPLPITYVLVPALLTALAVTLALRVAAPRRRPTQQRRELAARGGLHMSRPSSIGMRASRKPPDVEITGRVWDPTQKKPVVAADVHIECGTEERSITCDQGGRFATGPLPIGQLRLVFSAPGYVREEFPAMLPHSGELRDLRVDLIPIRHRIMEVYREAAMAALPERALWGFWTPRELLRFVNERPEARLLPLKPLTEVFEEVYYTGRDATTQQLDRARAIAATIGRPQYGPAPGT